MPVMKCDNATEYTDHLSKVFYALQSLGSNDQLVTSTTFLTTFFYLRNGLLPEVDGQGAQENL